MKINQISYRHFCGPKSWYDLIFLMKITILILFACVMQASALSAFSQQVTISKKNIRVEELLMEIRKQTQVDFFYDKADLSKVDLISVNFYKVDLNTALNEVFEKSGLDYNIKNGVVYVNKPNNLTIAMTPQQLVVQGVVTDQDGLRLSNVNIEARGDRSLSVGSRSDNQGKFKIMVNSLSDTLRFSMLGYEKLSEPLRGRREIMVTLKQAVMEIEDVVITGVYTRKAESFTGASMTLKNADLKKAGSVNVFQALKNISPGMFLDNLEMGSNPNSLPNLQIRGNGSLPIQDGDLTQGLKGNYLKDPTQPLFILDGFEASVERIFDLDINRIESVTILKDAASKALYGSKAANGVIVIETFRMTSDKPMVTYNGSLNIEMPDLSSYNLTNAAEKLEAERIDGMYLPMTGPDPAGEYLKIQQLYNSRKKLIAEGLDTYWLAKPLQNGIGQKHALSIELGNKDLKVLTDVLYNNVQGAMIGSSRRNMGGSISASYRLDNFLFRNLTSVTQNRSKDSPYGTFDEYVRMNPYWRATNVDGTIPYYAEILPNDVKVTNPLFNSTLQSKLENSYLNFTNNLYVEWTMKPGLRATGRFGIDLKSSDADEFYPANHTRFENYFNEDIYRKGSYQVNNGKSSYVSGDLNVNYSKEINRHYIFGNIGYNISQRSYHELTHFAEGFPSDRLQDIIFARSYALDSRPAGIDGITRDMGFLAATSYMWDNRFMTDFTYRANASSQFGADKRWASFWSAGIGWNLHNESFLKDLGWVEQFKLRGSLGATGNQNFNRNASIATYKYALDAFYQKLPGSQLINLANPGLQWESSFDYNAGADIRFKRLGIRFDYYQRYTQNLLADVSVPISTGFNSVKDNLGKIKNTGLEGYINYTLWQQGRDYFSIQGGIETNTSKIIELSNSMKTYNEKMDAIASDLGRGKPIQKYQDGMSMDAIWAVPSLGIDPSTGDEIYVTQEGYQTYLWNASDMVVQGVARPKYQGTFGFSGEYKGIGLSVMCRYLGGGQLYNQTLVDRVENVDMAYNVDKRVLTGRWLAPGQNAQFKRLGTYYFVDEAGVGNTAQEMTRATSRFVQDRRELTISAVNLYYDFYRHDWLKKSRLQRLRAAFNMNDLAQFSSITIERGTSYPFSRTMSFSLTATF